MIILILFLISGKVYAEKTTCRSMLKNPFHEVITVTVFWGHYRGYIFEKTGEILDMEKNKILERISGYIKKKCKINKRIDIFNELVFQGIKDEFKVKIQKQTGSGLQKIKLFFKRLGVKDNKKVDCLSNNIDFEASKLILAKWEEISGESEKIRSSHLKKVFSKKEYKFLNRSIEPLFKSDSPCP
jgi:hypothetical protein